MTPAPTLVGTVLTVADGDNGIDGVNADLLFNDSDIDGDRISITAVAGSLANIGRSVDGIDEDGSNGGEFTLEADGSWTFDPDGDFADLDEDDPAPHHLGDLHHRGWPRRNRHGDPDGHGAHRQRRSGGG